MSEQAPPRRITRSTKPEHVVDGVCCCFCGEAVPFVGEHMKIKPCNCFAHPTCLLDAHARRGTALLGCPRCSVDVDAHVRCTSQRVPIAPAVPYGRGGSTPMGDEALQKFFPLQHMLRGKMPVITDTSFDSEFLLLYAAHVSSREGEDRFTTETVTKELACPSRRSTEDDCDRLCEFFAFLYPRVTIPSMTPRSELRTLRPRAFHDHVVRNYKPLIASLFGLATGRSRRDLAKINSGRHQDFQSQYLAVAAASDLLIRCTTRYPGLFQLMVGDQLDMQPVSSGLYNLLSAWRVAPSPHNSDRSQCENIVKV